MPYYEVIFWQIQQITHNTLSNGYQSMTCSHFRSEFHQSIEYTDKGNKLIKCVNPSLQGDENRFKEMHTIKHVANVDLFTVGQPGGVKTAIHLSHSDVYIYD